MNEVEPQPTPIELEEVSTVTILRPSGAEHEAPPPPAPVAREPFRFTRNTWLHIALFLLILAAGFYFRFAGLNWDEREHVHPDELFLTDVLTRVRIPDNLGSYFDSQTSPLNPRNVGKDFFVYGDFPITFTRLAAETIASLCIPSEGAPIDAASGRPAPTGFDLFMRSLGFDQLCVNEGGFTRDLTGFDDIHLVGRVVSGLFDMLTLLWLFLTARYLFGTRTALLAMAFGALAVLHIQQSHFFTSDTFAATFVAMSIYFAVRANRTGASSDLFGAGLAAGLAVACRINILPLLGVVALPPVLRAIRGWGAGSDAYRVERALSRVVFVVFVAVIAFRIFMPNAFTGLFALDERFTGNMSSIQAQISGEQSSNPDVQWTNRPAYVFPWINMVVWGLGLPLGLTAWAGWAFASWKILGRTYRESDRQLGTWLRRIAASKHILMWVWITGYFGYTGGQWVKSIRYLLPLYPSMAIFAAWLLISAWRWAGRAQHRPQVLRWVARAWAPLILLGTFLWAAAFTAIYRRPEAAIAASNWIYDNVPTAATLHIVDAAGAPHDYHLQLPRMTTFAGPGLPQITGFHLPEAARLTGITFRELYEANRDVTLESFTLIVSEDVEGNQPISQGTANNTFNIEDEPLNEFSVELLPAQLQAGADYYLIGYSDSAPGPLDFTAQVVLGVGDRLTVVAASTSDDLPRGVLTFRAPQDAVLSSTSVRSVLQDTASAEPSVLRVRIAGDPSADDTLAEANIEVAANATPQDYSATFAPVSLEADREYFFVGESNGVPLVAESSTLMNEHWDRGIPLRTGGRDGFSFYNGFEIQNYNDDTQEKLTQVLSWIDQTDYIFLATNRLSASIPRQPLRYPMTSEYYRLLFTGQLGFEQIGEFTSYPTLGPFQFVDQESTQALGLWPDPTRQPEAGVILVDLPPAEEAFTVYDHPRVLLFKKSPDFSLADVTMKLSGFDLEAAFQGFRPRDETAAPTGVMLTEDAWEVQQQSGTWSELFDRNSIFNTSPGVGVLAVYLVVMLLGWIAFPIVFVTLPGLADRGYGLSRTVSILLVSFGVWFLGNYRVLPFTRGSIILVIAALLVVSALIARARWEQIRAFVRQNKRLIVVEELVFVAAFALFLALRFGNPDLWHASRGGEKPMDFAYFNAVLKSQYFPPYDPWFSGGFLVYYYYGWVMLGTLAKLLGIVPAIAYNIVVPLVFGLAAVATFSVAHGLSSKFGARQLRQKIPERIEQIRNGRLPVMVGIVAAVFVMLIGNLGEVKLITDELAKVGQTELNTTIPALKTAVDAGNGLVQILFNGRRIEIPTDWWYWNPTRIIPPAEGEAGPITEFPFFTFLYADLHAHMMALPLTILVIGLAVSWVLHVPLLQLPNPSRPFARHMFDWLHEHWAGLLSLVLGGLAVGAIRATNTPDLPTYLGLSVVAIAFGTWQAQSLKDKQTWVAFIARVAIFGVAYVVLFSPFTKSDRLGVTHIEGWTGSTTVLWAYIFVHGIFLFPIVSYLLVESRSWGIRWLRAVWNRLSDWHGLLAIPLIIVALGFVYFLLRGVTILAVAGPLMMLSLVLMLRPRLPGATRLWLLMVTLALALSFAVEVVVFSGDISRMNMVFKFYYQIWVLLGIAAAVALGWLWQRSQIDLPRLNGGWRTAMVVLVSAGLLYTPFAARAKLSERSSEDAPSGLDGMVYMKNAEFGEFEGPAMDLSWDYEALIWMQDNIQGTPVVAEGRSRHEYLWGSRVSIYTGLPTLYGWGNHQRQQRGVTVPGSVMERHTQDVDLFFNGTSDVTTQKIIKRYNIKYIYVGQLEHGYYTPEGLAKFDRMVSEGTLRVAYSNPQVTLYEVATDG